MTAVTLSEVGRIESMEPYSLIPLSPTQLIDRVTRAMRRRGMMDQPCGTLSQLSLTSQNILIFTAENRNGVLARYRVYTDGRLRRLEASS